MDKDTLLKYFTRLEKGYGLKEDPLYNSWSRLKKTAMSDPSTESAPENPIPKFASLSISTPFKQTLTLPKPIKEKTKCQQRCLVI